MPDMVFPNNVLSLTHQNGALLQFNALDALRYVSNGKINVQLACAEAWKESRYMQTTFDKFTYCYKYFFLFTCVSADQKVVNI